MATIDVSDAIGNIGFGRRGLEGKDAVYEVGRAVQQDICHTTHNLGQDIRGEGRAIQQDVYGEGHRLSQDVYGEGHRLSQDVHGVGRAIQQDVYGEGHRLAQDVREEGRGNSETTRTEGRFLQSELCGVGRTLAQDIRYEGRELGHEVKGVEKEVRHEGRHLEDRIENTQRDLRFEVRGIDRKLDDVEKQVRFEGRHLSDALCENKEAIRMEGCDGREVTKDTYANLLQEVMRQGAKTDLIQEKNYANIQLLEEKNYTSTLLELQKAKYDLAKNTDNGFNFVEKLMINGFKDARFDAAQNQMATQLAFKEQALLSRELACEAAKQLAECCCELKERIAADGQRTRDLLNEQARLEAVRRDQERTAEIFYLKSKLPNGVVV